MTKQPPQLFDEPPRAPTAIRFVCPPELRGAWVQADADAAMLALLLSNAEWFSQRNEHCVDLKGLGHHIEIASGSMKRIAAEYTRMATERTQRK